MDAANETWFREHGIGGPEIELPASPSQNGASPDTHFVGISHADVLAITFEGERFLIDDLLAPGAVATIAGVPETHKSWLAQKIAVDVARGKGEIFGRKVVTKGPVGYFWQDDSTREEVERVQLYEQVHASAPDLPLTWFLNEGVRLPDDLIRLGMTIEKYGFILVVLDSFYNFAPGIELVGEEASAIITRLKGEVCDVTGCHVLVVDHMPWATEQNRKRLRGYGGVFKGAATRSGIYLDAEGKKLFVEIRGNNITTLKRTLVDWNADTLELRLIDQHELDQDERREKLISWISQNPGRPTTDVLIGVGGKHETSRELLAELAEAGTVAKYSSRELGRTGRGTYWFPPNRAGQHPSPAPGRLGTTTPAGVSQSVDASDPSVPYRGTSTGRDASADTSDAPQDEVERLATLSSQLKTENAT